MYFDVLGVKLFSDAVLIGEFPTSFLFAARPFNAQGEALQSDNGGSRRADLSQY